MRTSSRAPLLLAVLVSAALALAGCTAAQSSGSDAQPAPAPGSAESFESDAGVTQQDRAAGSSSDSTLLGERQVVQTGTATITVTDPSAAADDAARIAVDAGGRVDDRTEQSEAAGTAARSSLTLRIPADGLTGALERLEALGEVVSVSISANDVTATVTDLDARIAALQASVDRLTALLAQAQSTADLIEIESSLSTRQADLDALTAQRDALGEQVAMSTLIVDLVAPGTVAGTGPQNFWQGLLAGWQGLAAAASGALVVLGILIPWLLPAALVVLAVLLLLRRRGRRRPAPAPATEPVPSPGAVD